MASSEPRSPEIVSADRECGPGRCTHRTGTRTPGLPGHRCRPASRWDHHPRQRGRRGRAQPGTPLPGGPARPGPHARSPPARWSHRRRPLRRPGRAASHARGPRAARQAASASDAPGRLRSWAKVMCTRAWVGCPARSGTIPEAMSRRQASSSASWRRWVTVRVSSGPPGLPSASSTAVTAAAQPGVRSPVRRPAPPNVRSSSSRRSSSPSSSASGWPICARSSSAAPARPDPPARPHRPPRRPESDRRPHACPRAAGHSTRRPPAPTTPISPLG